MTLQLIGLLLEVKPTESKDKKSGKTLEHTEIQVMFKGIDEKGFQKNTVETIQLDEEYYDVLKNKKDSYVCVSYNIINTPNGTYVFPDKDMPVLELPSNPLDYSKYDRSKPKKSSQQ